MTIFDSRQSDCGRGVCKNANASTLQIHVTNCTTKLRGYVHEAEKIQCNNVSGTVQEHVTELEFYTSQALPLVSTRFFRLANSSPKTARSPARRSRDSRETTGKTTGKISRVMSAQVPGNGRQWQRQCRRMAGRMTRKTTCLAADANARCPRRKLARQLTKISSSTMTPKNYEHANYTIINA